MTVPELLFFFFFFFVLFMSVLQHDACRLRNYIFQKKKEKKKKRKATEKREMGIERLFCDWALL